MAAEDELALPQVPDAKPDDPEDVSWSLSTAEAMWARGDHLEGIKWVRKAAEAASEVENDERALELAKAASELATIIARRSRASQGEAPPFAAPAAPALGAQAASAQPVTGTPITARSNAPSVPPPARSSRPPPPIALPSRSAQPPRSFAPSGGTAIPRSFSPSGGIAVPRSFSPSGIAAPPRSFSPSGGTAVPRPPVPATPPTTPPPRSFSPAPGMPPVRPAPSSVATAAPPGAAPSAPASAPTTPGSFGPSEPPRRRPGPGETAPLPALDRNGASEALRAKDDAPPADAQPTVFAGEKPTATAKVLRPSDPDPTIVARIEDLQQHRQKSAAEWDMSPKSVSADDADLPEGDRLTAFGMTVAVPVVTAVPPVRPPQASLHDPEIQTSQAVRVVVWRDANGVHVAPAGTVVSAITIDAVLVVLEEGADLTAWLSQRAR